MTTLRYRMSLRRSLRGGLRGGSGRSRRRGGCALRLNGRGSAAFGPIRSHHGFDAVRPSGLVAVHGPAARERMRYHHAQRKSEDRHSNHFNA